MFKNKTHCLLLSGGMDSTSLLLYLLYVKYIDPKKVLALQFKVNTAQNKQERKAVDKICKFLKVDKKVLNVKLGFGKSLMKEGNKKQISGTTTKSDMEQVIVPFRNPLYMSHTINYIMDNGFKGSILMGMHKGDLKFPDCTPLFINYFSMAVSAGTKNHIKLEAPFLDSTKRQIITFLQYRMRECILKKVLNMTYSCYMGGVKHCGKCQTCLARKKALKPLYE